jgi:lactate racemase
VNVHLAYGRTGLDITVPDGPVIDVIEPGFSEGFPDQAAALGNALSEPIGTPPLRELVSPGGKVGIVVSDITRATPYPVILPVLLDHLDAAGEIVFFVATGTHRPNTDTELRTMLGDGVVDHFRIVQNDCGDLKTHRKVGTTATGNDIWLLSEFLDCDVRISTGFIEPHFFAGFSGGGKAIMPGLALLETIQRNHNASNMDHCDARWGVTSGNPLWEEVCQASAMANPSFLLNVTLNRLQNITRVFAGDSVEAHRAGCEYVRRTAMAAVDEPYDIVVASNSGYPLDLNLYQSVKGMSAAAQIVKQHGHIVQVADCWDGIPDHGSYGRLLADARNPDELLAKVRTPGFAAQDQWQAHIHSLIVKKATVHFYSHNLSDKQLRNAFLEPCADVSQLIGDLVERLGPDARVCILPEGPQTIPYVRESAG